MKRNFKVEKGNLTNKEKIAVLRIVNGILTKVESGEDVDRTIRFADCSELNHRSQEDAWLLPVGGTRSETTGFVVEVNHFEDGQWQEDTLCEITVPALAELTAVEG